MLFCINLYYTISFKFDFLDFIQKAFTEKDTEQLNLNWYKDSGFDQLFSQK